MSRQSRFAIVAVIVVVLLITPSTLFARPATSRPADIRLSNLTSLSFTVSWVTLDVAESEVRFGTTPDLGHVFKDVRGDTYRGRTHYVVVNKGLQPDTTYYFDVASDGDVDDNNRQHYQVKTAPVPDSPSVPEQVVGFLKDADGSLATEAIVYATIVDADGQGSSGESTLMSSLVKPAPTDQPANRGMYQFIYSNALEKTNLAKVFQATAQQDKIRYEAVGPGGASTGSSLVTLETGISQAQLTLPTPPPTSTPGPTQSATPTSPAPATATPTAESSSPTPAAAQSASPTSPTAEAQNSPAASPIASVKGDETPESAASTVAQPTTAGPTPAPTSGEQAPAGASTTTTVQPTGASPAPTAPSGTNKPAVVSQLTASAGSPAAGRSTPASSAAASRSAVTPTPPPGAPTPAASPAEAAKAPAPSNAFGWVPIVLFGVALTGAVGAFAYLARRIQ